MSKKPKARMTTRYLKGDGGVFYDAHNDRIVILCWHFQCRYLDGPSGKYIGDIYDIDLGARSFKKTALKYIPDGSFIRLGEL